MGPCTTILLNNHVLDARTTEGLLDPREDQLLVIISKYFSEIHRIRDKFLEWYELVEDAMVEAGVAQYVEHFDPKQPYGHRIIVTHPDLCFSFDQTGFSCDMSDASHSFDGQMVTFDADDNGDTLAHKTSTRATITGGTTMAGGALPGLITYKKG